MIPYPYKTVYSVNVAPDWQTHKAHVITSWVFAISNKDDLNMGNVEEKLSFLAPPFVLHKDRDGCVEL